jgi:hypothetical protein
VIPRKLQSTKHLVGPSGRFLAYSETDTSIRQVRTKCPGGGVRRRGVVWEPHLWYRSHMWCYNLTLW